MGRNTTKKMIYPELVAGQEVFSTFDVSRIVNIERERLREWMKSEYIPSGSKVAWKGGYKVVWGRNALYAIKLFKLLVESGLEREAAAGYADRIDWDNVRIRKERHLVLGFISSTGERQIHLPGTDAALKKIKRFEAATYVNLKIITEEIDRRVEDRG